MGELEQAKDYHQRALEIYIKVLGPTLGEKPHIPTYSRLYTVGIKYIFRHVLRPGILSGISLIFRDITYLGYSWGIYAWKYPQNTDCIFNSEFMPYYS